MERRAIWIYPLSVTFFTCSLLSLVEGSRDEKTVYCLIAFHHSPSSAASSLQPYYHLIIRPQESLLATTLATPLPSSNSNRAISSYVTLYTTSPTRSPSSLKSRVPARPPTTISSPNCRKMTVATASSIWNLNRMMAVRHPNWSL